MRVQDVMTEGVKTAPTASAAPPQIRKGCGCVVTSNPTHRRLWTGVSDVTVCGTLR